MPENPDEDIMTQKEWEYVYGIQEYSNNCRTLCQHVTDNVEAWQDWADGDSPQLAPLPLDYGEENELQYFHQLLLVKAMRPEKVSLALQEYVRYSLGRNFIVFKSEALSEIYKDTTKATPIIFVLTTGADPTTMLLRYCKEMDKEETLGVISLGQ